MKRENIFDRLSVSPLDSRFLCKTGESRKKFRKNSYRVPLLSERG